jgi:PST family polysaccharide transporter
VVIGRMLGTTVLGEYERAYQLMVMPANSLGQVVGRVLFPAMSRVQTSPASLRANYRRSLALTAVITLPVSVLFVILSPELVGVMLGPGWDRSVVALETLGAVLLFRASYKMSDELARACGAIWRQLWRQMVYAAAVLAGGVLGSRYGLSGASVGVALAIVLNFVLMTDLGRRLTGLTWREVLSAHRPALLLAVASAAGCATGALLARTAGVGNLTTVLLAGGLAAMAVLGLAFGAPRLLGQDARWLLALIGSSVPEPFATLLRRLVARIG